MRQGRTTARRKISTASIVSSTSFRSALAGGMTEPKEDVRGERPLSEDSEDEFTYEEVSLGGSVDDLEPEDEEEDLKQALLSLRHRDRGGFREETSTDGSSEQSPAARDAENGASRPESKAAVATDSRPNTVDDFIRNFLIRNGMTQTLDTFNTEWYERKARGLLHPGQVAAVPDVFHRNEELEEQVSRIRSELQHSQETAARARATWDKFRSERDFHRMHHKRVMQEKTKLIVDLKRLKRHFAQYEPAMKELKEKYELAMKEKMLVRLERDRATSRVRALEEQLKAMGEAGEEPAPAKPKKEGRRKGKGDSKIPTADVENPFLSVMFDPPQLQEFQQAGQLGDLEAAVSCVAFHPSKPVVAVGSDDTTWKMWSVDDGELMMSGDGHQDWIAGLDFHPKGTHLVTCAGDGVVKLWDFMHERCAATFTEHAQAAWDVSFHHSGDFIASCSMDQTAKLWDLHSERCRQTFRGHLNSVNSVCFQPFSHNLCTGSGDKTVSVWDMRSGLCVQTFMGHASAVNDARFSLRGDLIVSCDADGGIHAWDIRMVAERMAIATGDAAINRVSLDRSGSVLLASGDDGLIHGYSAEDGSRQALLRGHTDTVEAAVFDWSSEYIVSGSADKTVRVWCRGGANSWAGKQ